MRYSLGLFAASAAAAAVRGVPEPGPDGKYTLEAEGIKAKFVPFAASLSNLWVKDKNGVERDIVAGFDNASQYPLDPGPVYNGIPGRYTNRIGKGTFSIDNVTYSVTPLNNGPNLLHSGLNGWHTRSWNVSKVTKKSITFKLFDPANSTQMPGRVEAVLTYTLSKNTWNIEIDAISPEAKTPIQLTQHTYFQLDSYTRPNRTIWNHTLHMPTAKRVLAIDGDALPNGTVVNIPKNDIDDFWSEPKQLGHATGNANFKDHCGGGCNGYNTNWAFDDRRDKSKVAATLSSEWSGIKAELKTNQDAIVLYTCWWNDGKTEYKSTQGIEGATDKGIPSSGAIAIEAQDWVDGINHPEWGRLKKQIFGPGDKYRWTASWSFSTLKGGYGN